MRVPPPAHVVPCVEVQAHALHHTYPLRHRLIRHGLWSGSADVNVIHGRYVKRQQPASIIVGTFVI